MGQAIISIPFGSDDSRRRRQREIAKQIEKVLEALQLKVI
jgi:hypothetical protein